jgi:7-cyano-7-deazaguanine reductase
MRKENHFHEEICECIYKRLYDLLQPDELFVACLYTRRGGIDINPIRASNDKILKQEALALCDPAVFCNKTMRQ